ncbi:MAG: ribosome-associated translation inhibitor RaiA [Pseudomonadota bacterium]
MNINVTFRHMETTEALRQYATDKIEKVQKYLDKAISANIVLSVEKFNHIADVTITTKGTTIKVTESTNDMYASIDAVVDKIERKLKKYKDKMKNHKHKSISDVTDMGFKE